MSSLAEIEGYSENRDYSTSVTDWILAAVLAIIIIVLSISLCLNKKCKKGPGGEMVIDIFNLRRWIKDRSRQQILIQSN